MCKYKIKDLFLTFLLLVLLSQAGLSQTDRYINKKKFSGSSDFAYPQSLCIDSKSGHLWVADFSNNRVLRFDISNLTDVTGNEASDAAASFSLDQNYPNPFNSSTVISFRTGQTTSAVLSVIDPAGRTASVLYRGVAERGKEYRCSFNAERLSSGIYYYMLRTSENLIVKKMCLCK